jgi:type II secretory ATPase GspE/PulE/Tfp pilus assembly ATPase PilB-like protein
MSLSGNPTERDAGPTVPPAVVHSTSSSASSGKSDWTGQINAELTFRLIDSILPFEACLYHQVLPLALEGSRLKLGMVSLDDSVALDYVRRIMGYMNCSLTPQAIASEMHHAVLTAYLNYASAKAQPSRPPAPKIAPPKSSEINERTTLRLEPEAPAHAPVSPPDPQEPALPNDVHGPPVLQVAATHLTDTLSLLADLPAPNLLEELLGRMLTGGIGRLYFERHPEHGRILWSQNGVMQAVLEDLPQSKFEATIAALKQFAELPLDPIRKPQYLELERQYQNTRLLLRLRIVSGPHGEEANLQVLRGAALKFHQQQQVTMLTQDALNTAQALQRQINHIRTRMQFYPVTTPEQQSILPTLEDLLNSLHQQIQALKTMSPDSTDDSTDEP